MQKQLKRFQSFSQISNLYSLPAGRQVKSEKGFTLIEILVVVAIIGMLTAAIAVNTSAARVQSRDAKRKADSSLVAGALEIYFSENRAYPPATSPVPITSWGSQQKASDQTTLAHYLYPTYISSFPSDPNDPDGINLGGNGFVYTANPVGIPNAAPNTLYAIDVLLEGEDTTALGCGADFKDPAKIGFYVTGTFKCPGEIYTHYRTSVR